MYRKLDNYAIPFENTFGGSNPDCLIDGVSEFICTQQQIPEGQAVGLTQCIATLPTQKWSLDVGGPPGSAIQATHMKNRHRRNLADASLKLATPNTPPDSTTDSTTDSVGVGPSDASPAELLGKAGGDQVTAEQQAREPPCTIGGAWKAGSAFFEIAMETQFSFQMLALSPQDWLTASGTVTTPPDGTSPKLTVVYDNGKTDKGVVTDGCRNIDWGPMQPSGEQRQAFRYAWAVTCNGTAPGLAKQAHWSFQTISGAGSDAEVVAMMYIDPTNPTQPLCLDRSDTEGGTLSLTPCNFEMQQRFFKRMTAIASPHADIPGEPIERAGELYPVCFN
jgi:hypothetical protein